MARQIKRAEIKKTTEIEEIQIQKQNEIQILQNKLTQVQRDNEDNQNTKKSIARRN